MNRYNHIPEGCVTRKAFSQTCWPEVQSERYKIFLIVQQRQITCYLFFRKIGPQWDSCQTTFNYDGTVVHLTFARKSALHLGENVFSAWEKMDLPPHTCLLFVERKGTYRCSVGDDTVTFEVIGMQINSWLTTWFSVLSILLALLPSKEPTFEELNYCAWFPALVCHGPQSPCVL